MKVRVLAFAGVREIVGRAELEVELPPGSRLADLRRLLQQRHPDLADYWSRLALAVDGRLGEGDRALEDGSEVALLPPVSGGLGRRSAGDRVRLTGEALDPADTVAAVSSERSGAVVSFLGTVRDSHLGRRVTHLTYDAYRPMAIEALARIIEDLESADATLTVAISHRLGTVSAGEISVVIAVAAPHRDAAFEASRLALERLKREVPIWKQEHYADGRRTWREEEMLQPDRSARAPRSRL